MITKTDEIQMLRNCAATLGRNSYCGPWLTGVSDEIESLLRSDYLPDIDVRDTAKRCESMLADAQAKADEVVALAEKKAKQREDAARQHVAQMISNARRLLANADADLARF